MQKKYEYLNFEAMIDVAKKEENELALALISLLRRKPTGNLMYRHAIGNDIVEVYFCVGGRYVYVNGVLFPGSHEEALVIAAERLAADCSG